MNDASTTNHEKQTEAPAAINTGSLAEGAKALFDKLPTIVQDGLKTAEKTVADIFGSPSIGAAQAASDCKPGGTAENLQVKADVSVADICNGRLTTTSGIPIDKQGRQLADFDQDRFKKPPVPVDLSGMQLQDPYHGELLKLSEKPLDLSGLQLQDPYHGELLKLPVKPLDLSGCQTYDPNHGRLMTPPTDTHTPGDRPGDSSIGAPKFGPTPGELWAKYGDIFPLHPAEAGRPYDAKNVGSGGLISGPPGRHDPIIDWAGPH